MKNKETQQDTLHVHPRRERERGDLNFPRLSLRSVNTSLNYVIIPLVCVCRKSYPTRGARERLSLSLEKKTKMRETRAHSHAFLSKEKEGKKDLFLSSRDRYIHTHTYMYILSATLTTHRPRSNELI